MVVSEGEEEVGRRYLAEVAAEVGVKGCRVPEIS
jgi:hypothetical protein